MSYINVYLQAVRIFTTSLFLQGRYQSVPVCTYMCSVPLFKTQETRLCGGQFRTLTSLYKHSQTYGVQVLSEQYRKIGSSAFQATSRVLPSTLHQEIKL